MVSLRTYLRLVAIVELSALVVAACQGNNCNRAVTGTNAKPASSIRRADCSSFLEVTVYPSALTVTVTETGATISVTSPTITLTTVAVTITVAPVTESAPTATATAPLVTFTTFTGGPPNRKRQAAKPVPTYASDCSDAAAYSSACSCWGATARTVTAPRPPPSTASVSSTPTTTVTLTITVTPLTTFTPTTTLSPSTTVTPATTVTSPYCGPVTSGITGIGVAPPGRLIRVNSVAGSYTCCRACYTAAEGCTGWAYLGTDSFGNHYCFYATSNGLTSPTDTCPNGLGQVGLFPGGDADYAGGPGPCYRP